MALNKRAVTNSGRPIRISEGKFIRFLNYATNDTKAEILAAGYFNGVRADLSVASVCDCVVDVDGTPAFVKIMFATVPDTGNVTVTDITGDTTPD